LHLRFVIKYGILLVFRLLQGDTACNAWKIIDIREERIVRYVVDCFNMQVVIPSRVLSFGTIGF
jgi:hypothetical protein